MHLKSWIIPKSQVVYSSRVITIKCSEGENSIWIIGSNVYNNTISGNIVITDADAIHAGEYYCTNENIVEKSTVEVAGR